MVEMTTMAESLKVRFVTSPREVCGVREYSEYLAGAYADISPSSITLTPCDQVASTSSSNVYGEGIIHIQYQEYLYRGGLLDGWLTLAETWKVPVVVTFHDLCIPVEFPFWRIHAAICHSDRVATHIPTRPCLSLPLGIPLQPYTVVSFGLGRTNEALIQGVCAGLKMRYVYLNGAEKWLTREDLIATIRSSDAVVLWYPEEEAAGSSFAARLAMGCRRPLVTNRVTWFDGVRYEAHYPCDDQKDLHRVLSGLREKSEWGIESETLASVAAAHLNLYLRLRSEMHA